MRGRFLAVLGAGLALSGCEQVCQGVAQMASVAPPRLCAKTVDKVVAFTGPTAKDRLVVESQGPDCRNPAMLGRIIDASGRLVFADLVTGPWLLNPEFFGAGGGTAQGALEAVYNVGTDKSLTLPAWTVGPQPPTGSYGAYEALLPREAYERFRQMDLPLLIRRGGGESGTIYVFDPEMRAAVALAKYAV